MVVSCVHLCDNGMYLYESKFWAYLACTKPSFTLDGQIWNLYLIFLGKTACSNVHGSCYHQCVRKPKKVTGSLLQLSGTNRWCKWYTTERSERAASERSERSISSWGYPAGVFWNNLRWYLGVQIMCRNMQLLTTLNLCLLKTIIHLCNIFKHEFITTSNKSVIFHHCTQTFGKKAQCCTVDKTIIHNIIYSMNKLL